MELVSSFQDLNHHQMWPFSKWRKNVISDIFNQDITLKSELTIPKSLESDWTTLSIKCCIPNIGLIDISGLENGLQKLASSEVSNWNFEERSGWYWTLRVPLTQNYNTINLRSTHDCVIWGFDLVSLTCWNRLSELNRIFKTIFFISFKIKRFWKSF